MLDVVNLAIWYQIKPYLPAGTRLTSVRRPAEAQLNFIVATARKHGYQLPRPASVHDPSSWQGALDFIKAKGYKVAAPGRSAHQQGIAYDFTGPDLQRIESAIRKAVADRRITLATSKSAILVETQNHCVHVEVVGAILHNEPFDFFHTV
jgi:hypothetical protein